MLDFFCDSPEFSFDAAAIAASAPSSAQLKIFRSSQTGPRSAPTAELPVPVELVEAFAEATGWVIGFEESRASYRKRLENGGSRPTAGTLKIVDMSSAWPAKTPTAHRAKCDRFVESLNLLISDRL